VRSREARQTSNQTCGTATEQYRLGRAALYDTRRASAVLTHLQAWPPPCTQPRNSQRANRNGRVADPPSEQQVHSKVSLRRAVDAVQRCGVERDRTDHQGLEKRQRRASSLRTWRWRARKSPCPSSPTTHPPYVPRPSAVDHVDRDMLNPTSDLLSHCHRRGYGV
jgi:hypothetical protein